MASVILTTKWEEPQSGTGAMCWELEGDARGDVEAAIEWARAYWEEQDGGCWGSTIPECELHSTGARGEPTGAADALQMIADIIRYSTGEDLYGDDCPIFEKHGVLRS